LHFALANRRRYNSNLCSRRLFAPLLARKARMSDEHSSFIKTPRQLAIVVVLAFAVPIGLIVLLSQLVTNVSPGSASSTEAEVLRRVLPVGQVTLADASAPTGNQTGEQVYQAVCKTCHEAGLAGAPKFGDKAAWAPRIKTGVNALYTSAIKGKNAMPPRGGSPDLSDVELQRAVVYMANKAGASFKEPPAPAAAPAAPVATAAAGATVTPAAAPAPAATPSATAVPATAAAPAALDLASGTAMMQKDGCSACHAVDKKILGPSYQDVAAKYKGDKDALAKLTQKVKAGGSGTWGAVPMPPNSQVSDADIKALVSWILTLKK
jgi:cytochrome c5